MKEALPTGLNDFLFAAIADDANGMHLTMLSALGRAGVDPWEEAASLRALSREDATARLASMLAGVPNGPSPGDDTATLAARLVVLLHTSPKIVLKPIAPTSPPNNRGGEPPLLSFSTLPRGVKVTIYSLLALILMIMGYQALSGAEPVNAVDRTQIRE
jgi:hypothetical protein